MTQHNVFIRKYGDKAVIITVTDWNDFKKLESFSSHKNPDFLVGATTLKSILTQNLPTMTFEISTAKDITELTKGAGLDGIITGDSKAGPIWSYRKTK